MKNNPIDQAVEVLEATLESGVFPKTVYDCKENAEKALTALRQLQEDYILIEGRRVPEGLELEMRCVLSEDMEESAILQTAKLIAEQKD